MFTEICDELGGVWGESFLLKLFRLVLASACAKEGSCETLEQTADEIFLHVTNRLKPQTYFSALSIMQWTFKVFGCNVIRTCCTP